MNKFYCISIVALSFVSQSSFAQLHVDSLGHVGVGVTTPLVSNLAVGKAGSIYYNAHVTGPGSGVYGEFKTYTGSGTTHSFGSGVHGYGVSKGTTYVAGLRATVERGSHSESGTDYAYGVYATAADAGTGRNYAVFGHLKYGQKGAAIYGTTASGTNYGNATNGKYAGYFVGDVIVNGILQYQAGGLITSSVPSLTTSNMNIRSLSGQRESVVSRLSNIETVSYYQTKDLLVPTKESVTITDSLGNVIRHAEENAEEVLEELELTPSQKQYIEKKHYGLPIDQLEQYYPELIYETENGEKGINYTEMIPLLLQSIKELKAEIEELKRQYGTK